jgi:hypothetical protein
MAGHGGTPDDSKSKSLDPFTAAAVIPTTRPSIAPVTSVKIKNGATGYSICSKEWVSRTQTQVAQGQSAVSWSARST